MVLIADDLAAWLTALLADMGRKKLTSVLLGTEQERALRSAATAAVWQTAEELHPGDSEQAGHVAWRISQVFSQAVSNPPLAVHSTVLEALQAGIAGQLVVLDGASMTKSGQSSAGPPEVACARPHRRGPRRPRAATVAPPLHGMAFAASTALAQ